LKVGDCPNCKVFKKAPWLGRITDGNQELGDVYKQGRYFNSARLARVALMRQREGRLFFTVLVPSEVRSGARELRP
jgi:hypothetical protein